MIAAALPAVPTLDASPVNVKPSGAWYKKAKLAKERGLQPPPRPTRPFGLGIPGPNTRSSSTAAPHVAPDAPAPVAPAPAGGGQLTQADVQTARVEETKAEGRAALLTLGRDQLERRIGSLGALGFRLAGILLGDEESFALSDPQREELAVLFVEAFPDECAQLVQDGNAAKLLALGTLGQVIRQKWTTHKARQTAPAGAPVKVVEPTTVKEPERAERAPDAPVRKFEGLPDMQRS